MKEDKELLEKLKQILEGEMNGVALKLGVSCSSVVRVLNGVFKNEKILNACIKRAKEIKKQQKARNKTIENL